MKDYKEAIESIMKDTTSKVIEHAINAYHQGLGKAQTDSYVKGYEDGKADTPFTDTEKAEKRAYGDGMNLAWECARKMCLMSPEERLRAFDVSGNHIAILSDLTAPKAIAKIKEYEDKQKQDAEIKVGDEVIGEFGNKGIVITNVPSPLGDVSVWFSNQTHVQLYPVKNLSKTGRHFDQIAEVLAELRGAE